MPKNSSLVKAYIVSLTRPVKAAVTLLAHYREDIFIYTQTHNFLGKEKMLIIKKSIIIVLKKLQTFANC